MKKHLQKIGYPFGDCVRTCIASILDCENVEEIPNFMKDGEDLFSSNLNNWCIENNMFYIQFKFSDSISAVYNNTLCIATGKKKSDGVYHSIIVEISQNQNTRNIDLFFVHDPLGRNEDECMEDFESISHITIIGKIFK